MRTLRSPLLLVTGFAGSVLAVGLVVLGVTVFWLMWMMELFKYMSGGDWGAPG